ncbi:MAG: DUF507 family protein [Deltaproteobacteria bacterium]|nr:DUF507 family protein [Deltaproteobacteria bacterium]
MQLKFSQIDPMAGHILKFLKEQKVASFVQSDEALVSLIADVFRKNAEEEEKLNQDAKKLLDQNKAKIGQNIDEERAFSMIKKQLAKERDFVL